MLLYLNFMERINDLEELLRYTWNLLFRGAVQNRHPYHTPVLATTNGEFPSARTVVLRETKVEERQLLIYTDMRTPKVEDLQQCPFASLVFWDKGKSVQIRVKGEVHIHHQNEISKEKWGKIPAKNRKDYATVNAPGTTKDQKESFLPEYWSEDDLNSEKTEEHYANFVVLSIEITEIDFLHLDRSGHQRAQFLWQNQNWQKAWIVP